MFFLILNILPTKNDNKGVYQCSQLALFGHHFTVFGALSQSPIWRFLKVGGAFLALSGYLIKISEYHDVEMQIVT